MATLDDLDARLRALEAARPDPLAAVPPIRIGELTDVPTPGSAIAAAWAQEVTNRCRHRFPNVAARDTYWPPATAGNGAHCVTTDTGIQWVSNGAAWIGAAGTIYFGSCAGGTSPAGGGQVTVASINLPAAGVYMVFYSVLISSTAAITAALTLFVAGNAVFNYETKSSVVSTSFTFAVPVTLAGPAAVVVNLINYGAANASCYSDSMNHRLTAMAVK